MGSPGDGIVARYEARRRALVLAARSREADLPLRFLRQTSHFTTPASNPDGIKKAVAGIAGARRLLEKLGIVPAELASALGCEPSLVEAVLATPEGPPLVLVDAEDATANDPGVLWAAREHAVAAFTGLDWGRTLAFYRPSGLGLESCVEDLAAVIGGTAERTRGRRFPIDGVTWPKASHEDELAFLDDLLSYLEAAHGLPRRTIRVQFLVESGGALTRLERLVETILPRLAGIVWGSADYAADVGLPRVANDHPSCDAARAAIVNVAGARGVPAIDSMTFEYPVRDPALDAAANKARILAALRACYRDARHGLELGLEGKWVGHPLQLVANELAYRAALDPAAIDRDVAETRAYLRALSRGQGTTLVGGAMADRATDRHVRRRLRRALAQGALAPPVAAELGIASPADAPP